MTIWKTGSISVAALSIVGGAAAGLLSSAILFRTGEIHTHHPAPTSTKSEPSMPRPLIQSPVPQNWSTVQTDTAPASPPPSGLTLGRTNRRTRPRSCRRDFENRVQKRHTKSRIRCTRSRLGYGRGRKDSRVNGHYGRRPRGSEGRLPDDVLHRRSPVAKQSRCPSRFRLCVGRSHRAELRNQNTPSRRRTRRRPLPGEAYSRLHRISPRRTINRSTALTQGAAPSQRRT